MKTFMDDDFLLETETGKTLYHKYAKTMPIIDYHCHINPQQIAEDLRYNSITDVWLGGDHYKWRLMRANGIPESEITGSIKSDPYLVFENFAKTMPKAIGNPLYHWSYLELRRYFGVQDTLNQKNSKKIYDHCNSVLAQDNMSVQGIIKQSNVDLICTTDDPIDSLCWHEQIKNDDSIEVKVLPTFRPDKAVNINKEGFIEYIQELSNITGQSISNFKELTNAIENRIEYFAQHGCKVSDHALDYIVFCEASDDELNNILSRALAGESISEKDTEKFKTAITLFCAEQYTKRSWVMQIHFGCIRNNNSKMFDKLGADTGFDAISGDTRPQNLAGLLDLMYKNDALPKMVLYSLNENDNQVISTIAGCFMANSNCPGKIQLGSAWWFNDTKAGMEKQLLDYANSSLLGNFIGMLTDSRSFLSYTRHEYFRRILCNFIGKLVDNGEYINDEEVLGQIVQDICYNNTARFFGFEI